MLRDSLVVLETNYRSERRIQEVARRVNALDATVADELPMLTDWSQLAGALDEGGCRLTTDINVSAWRQHLDSWAKLAFDAGYRKLIRTREDDEPTLRRLFDMVQRSRILTLIREGPWGCTGINDYLVQHLRSDFDSAARAPLYAGMPILITRNDHERQLFNGDVGIVLHSKTAGYRAVFARSDRFVSFPADAIPSREPAFALTVHKSQGSEYGRVLLVMPPEGARRLLTKEMIYTAITRAKDAVVVQSPKDVLKAAISHATLRDSALLGAWQALR